MKEMAAALLLFALMASVAVGSATSSRGDDSKNAFWEKFKTAVIKGDKEAVAGMSAFPISMGYGMSSIKSKAQFMKNYKYIFVDHTHVTIPCTQIDSAVELHQRWPPFAERLVKQT